jgi:hypothetical protein
MGRFVAAALNHFADSGEMAKYLSENANSPGAGEKGDANV